MQTTKPLPQPQLCLEENESCQMEDCYTCNFTVACPRRIKKKNESTENVTQCERLAWKGPEQSFSRQITKAFQIVSSKQLQWFDSLNSKAFPLCAIKDGSWLANPLTKHCVPRSTQPSLPSGGGPGQCVILALRCEPLSPEQVIKSYSVPAGAARQGPPDPNLLVRPWPHEGQPLPGSI